MLKWKGAGFSGQFDPAEFNNLTLFKLEELSSEPRRCTTYYSSSKNQMTATLQRWIIGYRKKGETTRNEVSFCLLALSLKLPAACHKETIYDMGCVIQKIHLLFSGHINVVLDVAYVRFRLRKQPLSRHCVAPP
jgi:hypothetical protein